MKVFIVYTHPSEESFTRHVRDSFIKGLEAAKHSYILSDLYKMNFISDMNKSEYLREANYRNDLPIPNDVVIEQEKINSSDAIVFIYPVFWTEAPAKLVGWFDRVWTYGFAYGNRAMKKLDKGFYWRIGDITRWLLASGLRLYALIELQSGYDVYDSRWYSSMNGLMIKVNYVIGNTILSLLYHNG